MAEGERHISHGGKQESVFRGTPLYKASDLVRLIHYHENSMGKVCLCDAVASYQVPPTTHGNSK